MVSSLYKSPARPMDHGNVQQWKRLYWKVLTSFSTKKNKLNEMTKEELKWYRSQQHTQHRWTLLMSFSPYSYCSATIFEKVFILLWMSYSLNSFAMNKSVFCSLLAFISWIIEGYSRSFFLSLSLSLFLFFRFLMVGHTRQERKNTQNYTK